MSRATTTDTSDPMVRLLSLRVRVLRAREQAKLLQPELPMFREELEEVERILTTAWLAVSGVIETMVPPGANDTDEDIEAEQKRILAEIKQMQRRDAMKGIQG